MRCADLFKQSKLSVVINFKLFYNNDNLQNLMSSIGKVCVIDGGFSSQLSDHVKEEIDGGPLWSAKYNYTHPEAIIQTHLDFLESGAEIILTNTYQVKYRLVLKRLLLNNKVL